MSNVNQNTYIYVYCEKPDESSNEIPKECIKFKKIKADSERDFLIKVFDIEGDEYLIGSFWDTFRNFGGLIDQDDKLYDILLKYDTEFLDLILYPVYGHLMHFDFKKFFEKHKKFRSKFKEIDDSIYLFMKECIDKNFYFILVHEKLNQI